MNIILVLFLGQLTRHPSFIHSLSPFIHLSALAIYSAGISSLHPASLLTVYHVCLLSCRRLFRNADTEQQQQQGMMDERCLRIVFFSLQEETKK